MSKCPKCGDPYMIEFSTHRLVRCSACDTDFPWPLKEGQPPLVTNNRDKRKYKGK